MQRRKRRRQRRCRHCKRLYLPDPRTQDRQKHCSELACKRASKAWRQRRWVESPKGEKYFREPDNVERVQKWRQTHPGYWRRSMPKAETALQDDCASQPVDLQDGNNGLSALALQDDCLAQPALVVGLIASLTGSALQDDIALTIRKMHARGQIILGMVPGMRSPGGERDRETSVVSGACSAGARAV